MYIGWIGFTGKIVEHLIKNINELNVQLSEKERILAAHHFLELHNNMLEGEKTANMVMEILKNAYTNKKPIVFSKRIIDLEEKIINSSKEFIANFECVQEIIRQYIQDLPLLKRMKRSLVSYIGFFLFKCKFNLDFDGLHPLKNISYTGFDTNIVDFDLYNIRNMNGLFEALESQLKKYEFKVRDFDKIEYLYDQMNNQIGLLIEARILLGEFIKTNFVIEDLLNIPEPIQFSIKTQPGSILKIKKRLEY